MISFSRRLGGAAASAAILAAAVYATIVLLYFAVSGSTAAILGSIAAFFAPTAVVLFLLLIVLAFVQGFRVRWLAGLLALVFAVLASWIGLLLTIVLQGQPLSGAALGTVFGAVIGYGLPVEVLTVLYVVTFGRRLLDRLNGRAHGRRVALVRPPSPRLADGQLTHQPRVAVDAELAVRQWRDYVAALEGAGWTIDQLPAADELPDSVFVEDTLVVIGGTAVVAYPGAESRRAEVDAARVAVQEQGYAVRSIEWPGTLDGGDVLQVGTTVYVGRSTRTNAEGIRQLRVIAAGLGRTVVAVPVAKVLHLKTAVTALPDGTVLGSAKTAPSAFFDRFLAVPEPQGAHVVVLSEDAVLIAASAPATAQLIADLGYRTVVVDISEFEKLEGSVTCLSVLLD